MTIDWFTFVAQILNFLVLIWLMKRFLYGPIINAMDQRESRIAARLSDASAAEETAIASEHEYRAKLDDLENTREDLLAKAGREVEIWRSDHAQQAKNEVESARQQWQQALGREKQALLREIQLDVATHATDLSRHVLSEMADARLQSLMVDRFTTLIKESGPNKHAIQRAVDGELGILIETSHELSEPERLSIRDVVAGVASSVADLEFKVNSALICGIELRAPGCKLAWSIRDSLAEVESNLIDSFDDVVSGKTGVTTETTGGGGRTERSEGSPGATTAATTGVSLVPGSNPGHPQGDRSAMGEQK